MLTEKLYSYENLEQQKE